MALLSRIAGYDLSGVTRAAYEQACAGSDLNGADDAGAYNYSVTLEIPPAERDQLSAALREFAVEKNLRFFDFRQGPSSFPSRRMAVFSARGLHVHVDMMTASTPAMGGVSIGSSVILVAYTFANHDEWPPVLRALDTMLRARWPDRTQPESLERVEPIDVPDLASWKRLTAEEQRARLSKYSYREEARSLLRSIVGDFRDAYAHVQGLVVSEEPGIYHGGSWVIDVTHPFIFDRRRLPREHLGVWLHTGVELPLPPEFSDQLYPDGYAWSPPNFERFVDRCANEIRHRLGNPTMSRAEMLHALSGMPFEDFDAHCRESVKKGNIPPFE